MSAVSSTERPRTAHARDPTRSSIDPPAHGITSRPWKRNSGNLLTPRSTSATLAAPLSIARDATRTGAHVSVLLSKEEVTRRMPRTKARKGTGFTLIELLVVIAIIAILAA